MRNIFVITEDHYRMAGAINEITGFNSPIIIGAKTRGIPNADEFTVYNTTMQKVIGFVPEFILVNDYYIRANEKITDYALLYESVYTSLSDTWSCTKYCKSVYEVSNHIEYLGNPRLHAGFPETGTTANRLLVMPTYGIRGSIENLEKFYNEVYEDIIKIKPDQVTIKPYFTENNNPGLLNNFIEKVKNYTGQVTIGSTYSLDAYTDYDAYAIHSSLSILNHLLLLGKKVGYYYNQNDVVDSNAILFSQHNFPPSGLNEKINPVKDWILNAFGKINPDTFKRVME